MTCTHARNVPGRYCHRCVGEAQYKKMVEAYNQKPPPGPRFFERHMENTIKGIPYEIWCLHPDVKHLVRLAEAEIEGILEYFKVGDNSYYIGPQDDLEVAREQLIKEALKKGFVPSDSPSPCLFIQAREFLKKHPKLSV